MDLSDSVARRWVLAGTGTASAILLAGCLGDNNATDDADTGDERAGTDETDDDDASNGDDVDDLVTVDLPADLTVEPVADDYLDRSGEGAIEVLSRPGRNDEPDYVFDPPFIAVDPGTTIEWVNRDGAFHTVTSVPDLSNRDGGGDIFQAEIGDEGNRFDWQPEDPGIYHYYCEPHTEFMWGSIAVLEDGVFPEPDGVDDETDEAEAEDDPTAVLPEDVEPTEVPADMPTDPTDDDFLDRTGQDEVRVFTRRGRENEPDFVFDPPFVRVDEGTLIRWINRDGIFHTVTSTHSLDSRSGGGESFDATISSVDDEFAWLADEASHQGYYCSPHAGFMFGAIDVE